VSFIKSLFRMSIQSKLPALRRTLINRRDGQPIDDGAERLLRAGLARDEYSALELLERHQLPVGDVIRKLKKPRRANWQQRLLNRLRSLEGSYENDPYIADYREMKRGQRLTRK